MLKNELKKILKEEKYKYLGIRGTDEQLELGEILGTSYLWNYEMDISTYETDEPIELGGVCAIDLTHEYYLYHEMETEEEMEEVLDWMIERIEYAIKGYSYKYFYIIGSDDNNPYNMDANDKWEAILEDAEVLMGSEKKQMISEVKG